jgi:Fe2+ or Zn2+ uptake regulation protein
MSYAQHLLADQRLLLLKALEQAAGYTLPERLLGAFLQSMAAPLAADALRVQLAWLEEAGLVSVSQIGDGASAQWTAALTPRGMDAARGIARVPGVARPLP